MRRAEARAGPVAHPGVEGDPDERDVSPLDVLDPRQAGEGGDAGVARVGGCVDRSDVLGHESPLEVSRRPSAACGMWISCTPPAAMAARMAGPTSSSRSTRRPTPPKAAA